MYIIPLETYIPYFYSRRINKIPSYFSTCIHIIVRY
nr:MAG TPA: hypothetical protein [Caudoviricetes sp.]